MNYEELIKDILKKRGMETDAEMDAFLHPSADSFHNPFLLSGMTEAVRIIENALKTHKKIVIYGDYDCDGICAVSILDEYLRSRDADVVGFIPSRHTDGYGLSSQTVEYILSEFKPGLVITVDTGISAKKEVQLLKEAGVEVIVTDHHEPPAEIPNTIVVDPKLPGQDYPFDGLSGAGVAFKLVQAMSDLDTALKYADIAAISTVGDIVPMLNENRALVKAGLKSINSSAPRPAIGVIKSKLKLKTLNSTDIAFKIVPRLNACGRISTAEKCYKFMVEKDGNRLAELYKEIEADNETRLNMSAEIMEKVDKILVNTDLNRVPAVFIRDDSINLGLIGIIASRLVNTLNRPVFVVTADESGNLKASVRSIEGINIFEILDSCRDILVDVGGHSLAGGLTVTQENYPVLISRVTDALQSVPLSAYKVDLLKEVDAEISAKDINLALARKLDELEPFGYLNPRPVFCIESSSNSYEPMKSIKHYKVGLAKNVDVISFFGESLCPYFCASSKKKILVTLELDKFFSTPRAKAILKTVVCDEYFVEAEEDFAVAKEIFYLYQNVGKVLPINKGILPNSVPAYGTMIIVDSANEAKKISNKLGISITPEPLSSGESVVMYNPIRVIDKNALGLYHNIFVVNAPECAKYLVDTVRGNVQCIGDNPISKLGLSREIFKNYYCLITKSLPVSATSFFECVERLVQKTKLSPRIVVATLVIGEELGFFVPETQPDETIKLRVLVTKTKKQLEESVVYNKIK